MGFQGKAFDNGLQAKAAGSKPILFPANQNLGRSGLYRSLARFSMRSPSRCSHRLFEPILNNFLELRAPEVIGFAVEFHLPFVIYSFFNLFHILGFSLGIWKGPAAPCTG